MLSKIRHKIVTAELENLRQGEIKGLSRVKK